MVLWFVGAAIVIVWLVFRDPAVDWRIVMAGVLVPDVIDAPFGGAAVAHTLLASVAALTAVMLLTRGRRHARRRWLFLPIGMFIHLVADGMWARTETFWWPLFGWSLADRLPSLERGLPIVLLQEVAGAAVVVWFVVRFGLTDPEARRRFLRTGRVPSSRGLSAG